MNSGTYRLILTGEVLEGHDRRLVVEGLGRLLKLSEEGTIKLISGQRKCLLSGITREKAETLQQRIIKRGAECIVEMVQPENAVRKMAPSQAAAVAKPGFGGLTLEPMEAKSSDKAATDDSHESAADGDSLDECLLLDLELPDLDGEAGARRPELDAKGTAAQQPKEQQDDSVNTGQYYGSPGVMRIPEQGSKAAAVSPLIKLALAGVVLALLFGGWWMVDSLFDSGQESSGNVPVAEVPTAKPIDPKQAQTEQQLKLLEQSVKVWMIQFGSGFDPAQVTLQRLQQDLGIGRDDYTDVWGRKLEYSASGEEYTLRSAGPDGLLSTADDISLTGRIQ